MFLVLFRVFSSRAVGSSDKYHGDKTHDFVWKCHRIYIFRSRLILFGASFLIKCYRFL